MPQESNELRQILELAGRRVRTAEGARLYGKPIGAAIDGGDEGEEHAQKRPMTLERLKSLQAQFEAAKRTGNVAKMKDIQELFIESVAEFRESRQDINLLRELTAARGRQAQAAT